LHFADSQHRGRSTRSFVPDRFHSVPGTHAVEQDVLPGDEAGLGAAQERAGLAEFFRGAEAPGGIELGALGHHRLHGKTALLGFRLAGAAQTVGIEGSRQQP